MNNHDQQSRSRLSGSGPDSPFSRLKTEARVQAFKISLKVFALLFSISRKMRAEILGKNQEELLKYLLTDEMSAPETWPA